MSLIIYKYTEVYLSALSCKSGALLHNTNAAEYRSEIAFAAACAIHSSVSLYRKFRYASGSKTYSEEITTLWTRHGNIVQ